jgi:hypothetical protein
MDEAVLTSLHEWSKATPEFANEMESSVDWSYIDLYFTHDGFKTSSI